MALTEKELGFLDKYKNEIESNDLTLVMKELANIDYSERKRLKLLITWATLGPEGFIGNIVSSKPDVVLEGVLKNRTGLKAQGVALLPAMYGKTRLRLFNIVNGKIDKEQTWVVTNPSELNQKMTDHNLAILDKPDYVNLVKKVFDGTLIYTGGINFNYDKYPELSNNPSNLVLVSYETLDVNTVKPKLIEMMKDKCLSYKLENVTDQVIETVMNRVNKIEAA